MTKLNINLYIGPTGSGKSTTIHFLSGSKMEKREKFGIKHHIEPVENKENPNLLTKIKTSPLAESETQFITSTEVSFKSIGLKKIGSICLCDTPGFEDTNGPEVDIANSIGIVKMMQNCKTVRPVILISSNDYNYARMQGLKNLTHILVGLLTDAREYLSSFTFLLTSFTNEQKEDFEMKLESLVESLEKDANTNDESFMMFFEELQEKIESHKPKFVDPIEGNPKDLLKYLIGISAISKPDEAFKFSLARSTNSAIKEQLRRDQAVISSSVKEKDYEFVEFKLNEMRYLAELLENDKLIKQIYQECLMTVVKVLNEQYENVKSNFNNCMSNGNSLGEENINEYKNAMEKGQYVDKMRVNLKLEKLQVSKTLHINLQEQYDSLLDRIKLCNLCDKVLKHILDKMKMLSFHFKSLEYNEKLVDEKFDYIKKSSEEGLMNCDFVKFSNGVKVLRKAKQELGEHLKAEKSDNLENEAKKSFIRTLDEILVKVNERLQKDDLELGDINFISKQIDIFDEAKSSFSSLLSDYQNLVDQGFEILLKDISLYFQKINDEIRSIFEEEKLLLKIEKKFEQLFWLQNIKKLNQFTSQAYYSTLEMIYGYLSTLKSELVNVMNNNLSNETNYDKIFELIGYFEDAKWFDKYKEGVYSETMTYIKENMNQYIVRLKEILKDMNLDLINYANIKQASTIIENICKMEKLNKFIPELAEHIVEAQKSFLNSVNKVTIEIRNFSYPNEQQIEDKEFLKIRNIKATDTAFKYLALCKNIKFLAQTDCNDLLSKLENSIKNYSDSTHEKIENILKSITDYSENDKKDELYKNSQLLACLAKELIEINKFSELSARFNYNENIFENLKSTMSVYSIELSGELELTEVTKQVTIAYSKLEIVKSLIQFDSIFENDTFDSLYKQFYHRIKGFAPKVMSDVIEALDKMDFSTLLEILKGLSNAGDQLLKYYFVESKKRINLCLNSWIERSKTISKLLINSISEESTKNFDEIVKYLEMFDKIKVLNDFIDKKEIENCKLTINKNIKEAFFDHFSSVETSIKSFNFIVANLAIKSLRIKCEILDVHCPEEIWKRFTEIKSMLNTEVDSLVKNYNERDIESFLTKPPKEDFEKLKNSNIFHHSNVLESLNKIILDKFREKLSMLNKFKTKREKEQFLRHIVTLSKTLPETVEAILKEDLERLKEDINAHDEEIKYLIAKACNDKDLSFFEENIEEFKKGGLSNPCIMQIEDFVKQQMDEMEIQAKLLIEKKSIDESLIILKQFNDYVSFSQKNLGFSRQKDRYSSICKTFSYHIKKLIENLNNYFKICKEIAFSASDIKSIKNELKVLTNILGLSLKDRIEDIIPNFSERHVKPLRKLINDSFSSIQIMFEKEISVMKNIPEIKLALDHMKRWNFCIKEIQEFNHSFDNFGLVIDQSEEEEAGEQVQIEKSDDESKLMKISYDDMVRNVEQKIKELKTIIKSLNLINDQTTKYEHERNLFYEDLSNKIEVVKQIPILDEHIINYPNLKNFDREIAEIMTNQCNNVFEGLNKWLKTKKFTTENCKEFHVCFSNLKAFFENVKLVGVTNSGMLKEAEKNFFETVDKIQHKAECEDAEEAAYHLIQMKILSDNITNFKKPIDEKIDNGLKNFKNKKGKNGGQAISKLGTILNNDPIGKIIISEHKILEGFLLALFNDKVQKHDINYVLENLVGDALNIEKLRKRYYEFDKVYTKLVKENLKPDLDLKEFVSNMDLKFKNKKADRWNASINETIPSLIAWIFSLWTLSNSRHFYDNEGVENQDMYLLRPHPAQVISILRLFGNGDDREALTNNLIEIGTGEGKSVILAVASCVFAIYGYQVSCACYSEYLSQRDFNMFLPMFELLGIVNSIEYGTFNKICENIINFNGNVRDIVQSLVYEKELPHSKIKKSPKRILLIDEVDVFLNDDFYGNIYRPVAILNDCVKPLIDFIWKNRDKHINFKKVKVSNEFLKCCEKYGEWSFLIEEAVKNMIADVNSFESPAYIVQNDKIGYVQFDGVSFNAIYGYKTLFAYYFEYENRRISESSLTENLYIQIKCGDFSYAEIPHQFDYIMGVTGTLKTLSKPESDIIENVYDISKKTFTPSVFGKNNLTFIEQSDVMVENDRDYFNRIYREIDCRLKGKNPGTERAVLVFFESKKSLDEFYHSKAFLPLKEYAKVLTEEDNLTLLEKDKFVKDATRLGMVNLITKAFGRGTDFVCRDDIVQANGGVHVIQTFVSEQLSEEIQIKGRTARQGELGSYSMVLLDKSLEKFLISIEDIKINLVNIYNLINIKRNTFFESQYGSNKSFIEHAQKEHNESLDFLQNLHDKKMRPIKEFLCKKNIGNERKNIYSRTVVLMDATGSMSGLLTQTKNTVGKMFERAKEILKDYKVDTNCFEIQFACYRDYDCGVDRILQASSWESKPDNLRAFMETIHAQGGGDYEEAIEIGFWHVNQENRKDKVSQVILIGDAPAKAEKVIKHDRETFHRGKWDTKFGKPTFYLNELDILRTYNVPVYTFYLEKGAKENFEEIAAISGTIEKCKLLNIHSREGAEALTDVVTSQILENVGNSCGKGNKLAEAYLKKFSKSYK